MVIGSVTPESIAYTARYCVDKLHARVSDPEYHATGRAPEFVTMSQNPAIGKNFYKKYFKQFLVDDQVAITPKFKSGMPRYYDKLYKRYFGYLDSKDFVFGKDSILDVDTRSFDFSPEVIKANRIANAALRFLESLPQRLKDREDVTKARLSQRPKPIL